MDEVTLTDRQVAAIENVKKAVDFLDRVRMAPREERDAVGRDHYVWLEQAARQVAKEFR